MRPQTCAVCRTRAVAMRGVAYCFVCWPGGPVVAPPCLRCGSRRNYYANGLCSQCHHYASPKVDSCRECLAWGATRHRGWRCQGCEQWATRFLVGVCSACQRESHVDARGYCRLCRRQRTHATVEHRWGPIEDAVVHGHQLFFADMFFRKSQHTPYRPRSEAVSVVPMSPVQHRQLTLFQWPRDMSRARRADFAARPIDRLATYLHHCVEQQAARNGWHEAHARTVDAGVRILLCLQDTPGAPIKGSDLMWTSQLGISKPALQQVLTSAGFFEEDRDPPVITWFTTQTADLPDAMRAELSVWLEVMRRGSDRLPRRLPRSDTTVGTQLRYALPAIRGWATRCDSLREIASDDIRQVLPPTGAKRSLTLTGLRSIFGILKARKLVFVNPTSRFHAKAPSLVPLPTLDLGKLRAALDSDNPACAALAALLAFHAVRAWQLCGLKLTDIRDGRLHLPEQVILLAEPVRQRLTAYLDYRNTRWPNTANQHLFLSYKSAVLEGPVSHAYLREQLGMAPQSIRQDRIFDEAIASGGDLRRVIDLFGLSAAGAFRYTASVDTTPAGSGAPGQRER